MRKTTAGHFLPRSRTGLMLLVLCICVEPARISASSSEEQSKALAQLNLEQLGKIEVTTASKEPENIWQTDAAVFVITNEDIRRSGATSIPQALRLAPGVEVARIASDIWAIGIRGFQNNFSKAVLVLIDGRSVYTPLFAGTYWDVQDLLLEDVDRIEVIRGPGATVWGPNSAEGVINIITKKAANTHGVLASALSGNLNHVIAETRYGGGNGRGFNYRVYGKGFALGPEFHSDHDNYDSWHQERGGFRMDWDRDPKTSFTLQGDLYGGISPHEVGSSVFVDSASGGNILGRWRRQFENGSDIYLQAYFDRTVRTGSFAGETRDTFDVDFVHHLKLGDRQDVSYGGGLRWSPNYAVQKLPIFNIVPQRETDHIHSAFVQDEIHFADDRVTLTLGAKLLHNNFSGFDWQPTGRVLWNPNPHQSFWAAVTRAVTTPSRIEEGLQLNGGQVSANPPVYVLVSGNPRFQSERLIGYEGGYRQMLTPRVYVDLEAFHNNYDNLQSFGAPTLIGNFLTIFYENAIAGSTTGVEIAPAWNPRPWWKLAGSYSYVAVDLHAKGGAADISSTGSVKTYEGSSPAHELKIQSTFNLGKTVDFDQSYRYASALPAQNVRAYQTMDARLGWRFAPGWEFAVVGQNLLQHYHLEWGTGDPSQAPIGVRRTGYISLTWQSKR